MYESCGVYYTVCYAARPTRGAETSGSVFSSSSVVPSPSVSRAAQGSPLQWVAPGRVDYWLLLFIIYEMTIIFTSKLYTIDELKGYKKFMIVTMYIDWLQLLMRYK